MIIIKQWYWHRIRYSKWYSRSIRKSSSNFKILYATEMSLMTRKWTYWRTVGTENVINGWFMFSSYLSFWFKFYNIDFKILDDANIWHLGFQSSSMCSFFKTCAHFFFIFFSRRLEKTCFVMKNPLCLALRVSPGPFFWSNIYNTVCTQ